MQISQGRVSGTVVDPRLIMKTAADLAILLDDEVLATALLVDRILFHCELINLSGKSYRLKNRKPFCGNNPQANYHFAVPHLRHYGMPRLLHWVASCSPLTHPW